MCGVNITPSFSLIFGSRFLESWKLGFSKPLLDLQMQRFKQGHIGQRNLGHDFFSIKKITSANLSQLLPIFFPRGK